jgi:L-ectoine synthase
MIVRKLDTVRDSERHILTDGWESARFLLKDDAMGFSFHITTMYAGKELPMHYRNHLEAVYVLQGEGTIEDLGTGQIHELKAGTLYALNAHDKHIVRPRTDIITACVFNPPVTGREVHDESGAYPAETDLLAKASAG